MPLQELYRLVIFTDFTYEKNRSSNSHFPVLVTIQLFKKEITFLREKKWNLHFMYVPCYEPRAKKKKKDKK